jgi:hypothetical protein
MTIKLFETEEEANQAQLQFIEKMQTGLEEDTKNYTAYDINWIPEKEDYKEVKDYNIDCVSKANRLFLLAHSKDTIKGKPQLIQNTVQRIPLLRKIEKLIQTRFEVKLLTQYKFIDDRYDKRYDGSEKDLLSFEFWNYRVIDNGKEYYVLSKNKLSEVYTEFKGMKIDLDDVSEVSNTLKLKKIACIFLLNESKPYIKCLAKKELIEHCQDIGWNEKNFIEYLFCHPDGKIYDYVEDFNILRIAQLLSAKYEGYPLHLLKMGPVGTGKTTEAEVLDFKFQEDQGILEAGSSRMKVLIPSFKEKPANLGYICNCNRIAIIDELMKMISSSILSDHIDPNNYFGGLNMLLEHKRRTVGSGNDNSASVQATAKICITTNNLEKKYTIAEHLNVVDPTTVSRFLVWVQNWEEVNKIYNKENIRYFNGENPDCANFFNKSRENRANPEKLSSLPCVYSNRDKHSILGILRDSFLTIFDSCQQFNSTIDLERIRKLFQTSVNLAKEPMKQVWRARGLHHLVLILDGLVKYRCLFKDYDNSFTAKEEDYVLLERIVCHMILTWDTNFNRDSWKGAFVK